MSVVAKRGNDATSNVASVIFVFNLIRSDLSIAIRPAGYCPDSAGSACKEVAQEANPRRAAPQPTRVPPTAQHTGCPLSARAITQGSSSNAEDLMT